MAEPFKNFRRVEQCMKIPSGCVQFFKCILPKTTFLHCSIKKNPKSPVFFNIFINIFQWIPSPFKYALSRLVLSKNRWLNWIVLLVHNCCYGNDWIEKEANVVKRSEISAESKRFKSKTRKQRKIMPKKAKKQKSKTKGKSKGYGYLYCLKWYFYLSIRIFVRPKRPVCEVPLNKFQWLCRFSNVFWQHLYEIAWIGLKQQIGLETFTRFDNIWQQQNDFLLIL